MFVFISIKNDCTGQGYYHDVISSIHILGIWRKIYTVLCILSWWEKSKPSILWLNCLPFSVNTKASFFIFAFYFHSDGNGMWPSALSHYPALCGYSLWLRPEFTITYFYNDPEMQPAHLAIFSLLLSSFQNGDSHCFSFQSFSSFSMKPFKIKLLLCEWLKTKCILHLVLTIKFHRALYFPVLFIKLLPYLAIFSQEISG